MQSLGNLMGKWRIRACLPCTSGVGGLKSAYTLCAQNSLKFSITVTPDNFAICELIYMEQGIFLQSRNYTALWVANISAHG